MGATASFQVEKECNDFLTLVAFWLVSDIQLLSPPYFTNAKLVLGLRRNEGTRETTPTPRRMDACLAIFL